MKTKRILLMVLAAIMCISLCSCFDIEADREKHAKLQDDGSIILNGQKYVRLPECDNLSPRITYSTGELNLTAKDVPLLLAAANSEYYSYLSNDGTFILTEHLSGEETYYCREDCYDKVTEAMEEDKEYFYCYEYSTYDHNTSDYVSNYYFLTDAEAAVIEEVLSESDGSDEDTSSELYYYNKYFDFSVELENRTRDLWFADPGYYSSLQLCYSAENSCYYLLVEDEHYEQKLYSISEEYNDILHDVMVKYIGIDFEW